MGGLIAVGVFSLITPLLGCIAAIRHQAAMLCLYTIAASFVLILQFSFGVAAAAVASMDRVPERMQLVFNDQYRDFDWKYLKDFLPPACYAAHTTQAVTYGEKTVDVQTSHPACSWNHTCTDAAVAGVRGYCCDAAGKCATSVDKKELCASTHTCVGGFLRGVAQPVAITALLTLFLEISAIAWACIVREQTKAGGIFAPDRNSLR